MFWGLLFLPEKQLVAGGVANKSFAAISISPPVVLTAVAARQAPDPSQVRGCRQLRLANFLGVSPH